MLPDLILGMLIFKGSSLEYYDGVSHVVGLKFYITIEV